MGYYDTILTYANVPHRSERERYPLEIKVKERDTHTEKKFGSSTD
jgi:hypothetical protein